MDNETRISLDQFINDQIIVSESQRTATNPNMDDGAEMDHWRVTLRRPGKRLTIYFSMGRGHDGKRPTAADVLDCMASDSSTIENAQSFEDWASELGYDTDSRKAHRTYGVCKRQSERLKKFLGDEAYETLLWNTERL